MKRFLLVITSLVLSFLSPPVQASEEFKTSYIVSYRYNSQGESSVEQNITLTNLFSQIYATSYTLKLKGESPKNISGSDALGPLKISTQFQSPDTTLVHVQFNQSAAGKGQSTHFTINYDGLPAVKNGQVWELTLPKLTNSDFADNYELHLYVPKSFGKPAYISPTSSKTEILSDESVHYSFTKDQVVSSGVVAAFGDFQTLDFTLKYHLSNSTSKKLVSKIALPPDTPYQKVYYQSLNPTPLNVTVDADGNWLAEYTLQPKTSITITASGQSHILSQPSVSHYIFQSDVSAYVNPSKYWQSDSPQIIALASSLSTPKSIYDYVVTTLDYDYSRLSSLSPQRYGAVLALDHPSQSLCTEFTDLFISLARAKGLPARELNGYALTSDPKLQPLSLVSDVLHAWPEFWDETAKVWHSIDPTWAKTTGGVDYFAKLDLAHFVFAIHGTDPLVPKSAGLYKLSPDSKDVDVKVGTYREYSSQPLNITLKKPFQFLPLLSNSLTLEVTNPNGIAVYNLPLTISAHNLDLSTLKHSPILVIPPYGKVLVHTSSPARLLPNLSAKFLSFTIGSQQVTYNIPESLFIFWYATLAITITLTIFAVAALAHSSWHLHLQRSTGSDPLRGQS